MPAANRPFGPCASVFTVNTNVRQTIETRAFIDLDTVISVTTLAVECSAFGPTPTANAENATGFGISNPYSVLAS